MNYIYLLLDEADDGHFSIEVLYTKDEADKLPQDMVWKFTDAQLDLLYVLLRPYYKSSGIYFYRSIEALIELSMCRSADEILTLLSWIRN